MDYELKEHITENQTYIPQMNITYPSIPDEPYHKPQKTRTVDLENNYPFLDRSFKGRLLNFGVYTGIYGLVFLLNKFMYGIKIEGRENLRKNKAMFKNGAMTIGNHVHRWDFIFILQAVKYRRMWFPAKASNIETSDANLIRGAGGIPIPQTLAATRKFNEAFDKLNSEKKWIHVFPESCRWDWYEPIRPFKLGAFKMAYRYQVPLIPIAISYRKPEGIWKLFRLKHPLITVRIGEPISTQKPEEITKNDFCKNLRKECHEKMCQLAGIKQNMWQENGD